MKKVLAIILAFSVIVGLTVGGVALAGDSQPASKATAAVSDISVISAGGPTQSTVLAQEIKVTGNNKDLIVDVSLETGLYTDTVVRTKNAERETATATACVDVMVKASPIIGYDGDGNPILGDAIIAEPDYNGGWVTFDYRMQALTAVLQGIITEITCEEVDPDGTPDSGDEYMHCYIDPDDLEPEEIGLLLDTMAAHSFNFVLMDLPVDTYLIEVIARVSDSASVVRDPEGDPLGEASANATIGLGSVTIETVRMIKGEVIEFIQPD